MALDHARNRRALQQSTARAAELLRAIPNLAVKMPNSEWTIGEAAAHVVASLRTYGAWAVGKGSAEHLGLDTVETPAAVATVNEARIATVEHSDPAALAELLEDATRGFLADSENLSGDAPFEWYDGVKMDLASMTSIMLAEVLVHFWDVAMTARRPWPIDPKDAEQMILGALTLTPYYVNKATTKGVRASYEFRIRGGTRVGIRLDDGVATVQSPPAGRYDCIVSADPVAMLLISFGRIAIGKPILTGKMLAFGRKPWLGLKFNTYFLKP